MTDFAIPDPVGAANSGEPTILFVCTANICRSAWAEARASQLLPGVRIVSAGTHALRGKPMDPTMAQTLPDGAAKVGGGQQMSRALAQEATVILAMEGHHRAWILDEFPGAIHRTFTLGQFVETIRNAPAGLSLEDLVVWSYQNRVPARRETDVDDPYGKGLAAAGRSAAELESLVGELARVVS